YSESILEASPLGRVLEQGAPGTAWKANPNSDTDHTIKFGYGSNAANEVRHFKISGTSQNPVLSQNPGWFYAEHELYKTVTKDENWAPADGTNHTTEECKDKEGRVVLKRTYNYTPPETEEEATHDTYYVYDRFGNLTYVVPPKVNTVDGVSPTELSEL